MKKGDLFGLIFLGGGILILGTFFLFADDASRLLYAPVDVGGGSISVPEGQQSMSTVTVVATLVRSGFITLHQSVGPAPGPIIGTSQLLNEGSQTVVIPLSESMTPGLTYIALLHVDDGDGVFEAREDMPVKVNETVVRVDFKASGESILIPSE